MIDDTHRQEDSKDPLPTKNAIAKGVVFLTDFIDLLMGLFRGAVFRHGGGDRKQPIKQPTEMPTSTMALMGRFSSLMGRFPTLMGRFTDFVRRVSTPKKRGGSVAEIKVLTLVLCQSCFR